MSREVGSRSVYVIGSSENPVKIGIADRVTRRLAELQTGCPDQLIVHHTFKVPFDLAQKIEAAAHEELKEHRRLGEWFNIHKDDAAAVVERLRARMLEARMVDARLKGDLIDRLEARYELNVLARNAVCDYRDRLDANETGYFTHANGFILKQCGMAPYAAFSIVIAQRKPLSGLEGNELIKAELALVKALNSLVEFDELYREYRGVLDWEKTWATLFREKNALRDKRRAAA